MIAEELQIRFVGVPLSEYAFDEGVYLKTFLANSDYVILKSIEGETDENIDDIKAARAFARERINEIVKAEE